MRALNVFALGTALVSFAACSGKSAGSDFGNDGCITNDECGGGHVCMVGVCLSTSTGGASGAGSGGVVSSGGALTTGGALGTGGDAPSTGGIGSTGGFGSGGSQIETGGGSNGGTGGSFGGDAGVSSGGSSTGGDGSGGSSTGGDGATGGASPEAGPPPSTGVYCGAKHCDIAQTCCLAAASSATAASSVCSDNACSGGQTSVACSATSDCPGQQKCCFTPNARAAYTCEATCPGAEIECTGKTTCGDGVCCETTTTTGPFESVVGAKCQKTCTGNAHYTLCHNDSDCPKDMPSCAASNLLSGFKRCWPTN